MAVSHGGRPYTLPRTPRRDVGRRDPRERERARVHRERSRVARELRPEWEAARRAANARKERDPGDSAILLLLSALMLGALLWFVVAGVDITEDRRPRVAAPVSQPSVRAYDPVNRVVFRSTVRTLTIRARPETARLAQGKTLLLSCGYVATGGSSLYKRRLGWPRGRTVVQLTLPAAVAASTQFCALDRGGVTLARAAFRG